MKVSLSHQATATVRRYSRVFLMTTIVISVITVMLFIIAASVDARSKVKTLRSSAATVSGTMLVDATLTAKTGRWNPSPVTLKYQWLRDGKTIKGANKSKYKLTSADASKRVSVKITGSKKGYKTAVRTSKSYVIKKASLTATPTPSISGTTKAGSILTANAGSWKPTLVTLSYQWLRDGQKISGATKSTYKLTSSDASRKVAVQVTGSKPGYTTVTRVSAAKTIEDMIKEFNWEWGPFVQGEVVYDKGLRADVGYVSPSVKPKYQWMVDGRAIPGESYEYYTPGVDMVGRKISVSATIEEKGFRTVTRVSEAHTVSCMTQAMRGSATLMMGDITTNTTLQAPVTILCPNAVIAKNATLTVPKGAELRLVRSLAVKGTLHVNGTADKPARVTAADSGAWIYAGLSSSNVVIKDAVLDKVQVNIKSGKLSIDDSLLEGISSSFSTSIEPEDEGRPQLLDGQKEIVVANSKFTRRGTMTLREWRGKVDISDTVFSGAVQISVNEPDIYNTDDGFATRRIKNPRGGIKFTNNTVGGQLLWIYDYCANFYNYQLGKDYYDCTTPTVISGNRFIDDEARAQLRVAIGPGSIRDNTYISTAEDIRMQYDDILSVGNIDLSNDLPGMVCPSVLPPYQWVSNPPTPERCIGNIIVGEGTTLTARSGAPLFFGLAGVDGELNIAKDDASTVNTSLLFGLAQISTTGALSISNADIFAEAGIKTSGELSILDSDVIGSTGHLRDQRHPMRYDSIGSLITQNDGDIYLDARFINNKRILSQAKGNAILRGTLVSSAVSNTALVQTCEMETSQCFIDARDFDWGNANGPYPSGLSEDPFVHDDPHALICGTGIEWPWAGADLNAPRRWMGGCDGSVLALPKQLLQARTRFDNSLQGFRQQCMLDPEMYGGACQVVHQSYVCLSAATNLAIEQIEPAGYAQGVIADAADALAAIERPTVRIPAAGASMGLQAAGALQQILSVRDAYRQCAY